MAERELQLSIFIRAYNYAKGALGAATEQVEALNTAVKQTSTFREAAANVGMLGAAMAGAGAAIALPLKGAVEEYGNVQQALIHLGTALDDTEDKTKDLAIAHEFAEKASIKFNVASEDVIQNLFLGASYGLTFKQAMDNATVALAVAKGGMGDAAEVGKSTAIIFNDFGDKTQDAAPQIQHFGDVVAYATRHFAFANVGQLTSGISESIGAAKAAGLPFEDLVATLSAFNKVGLQGGEAGAAVIETLQAIGRGGFAKAGVEVARFNNGAIDVIGTLRNLQAAAHATGDPVQLELFQRLSKSLGARGTRALAVDAGDLANIREQLTPENVGGAAAAGAAQMMGAFNEQIGLVGKSIDILKDKVGAQLAPTIQTIGTAFTHAIEGITALATAHPMITKFTVLALALSAAVLVVGGGLLALVAGAAFLAPAVAALATVFGLGAGGLALIAGGITAVVAALATWDPALLGKLWLPIKDIGLAFVNAVKFVIDILTLHWEKAFTDAGYNFMKYLAKGIGDGLFFPLRAIGHVATAIWNHLPHSPAKEGPLRDLNRVNISESIAQTISPAPIAAAMKKALQGVARFELSGLRAVATAVLPLALNMTSVSPAFHGGAGVLPSSGRSIVINYTVNIAGDAAAGMTADGLKSVLDAHGRDLARKLQEQEEIDARARF